MKDFDLMGFIIPFILLLVGVIILVGVTGGIIYLIKLF